MQALAVFGGTFNPVHYGHLQIAETALRQFQLDHILWVPAYDSPYKSADVGLAAFHHRVQMIERVIATHPQFVLSTLAAYQPFYAIDTLLALQEQYAVRHWYWLIGLDAFRTLPRWYQHQTLANSCHWLVAPRASTKTQSESALSICKGVERQFAQASITLHWSLLDMPEINLSSSLVREYCHRHCPIHHLVPEAVRTYILEQRLYQQV